MKPGILIVDDDENIRTQMRWALSEEYDVSVAEDREGALQAAGHAKPPMVLLDLGLPPRPSEPDEGMLALEQILAKQAGTKVVIISGQSEKENALRAIAAGAYDFLTKPVDTGELQIVLKRAYQRWQLERDFRELQNRMPRDHFEGMLGASPQMQSVFSAIRKVATTDAPVLILGESGTGKEMAARAIAHRSERREGPFVAINCGAIPENLLESELFGYEKGAFTGAHDQKPGRIEKAHQGTLFLDEVGELPPRLQVKLLRFLQNKRIERVGGRAEIQIDTRVIAATNSDLAAGMATGTFREDLYYRLAVVVISMPPLRDREGDIDMLATVFLKQFSAENTSNLTGFSQAALGAMRSYDWPGNVREMENRVRRAAIMAEGRRVKVSDLELGTESTDYAGLTLKDARNAMEDRLVRRALAKHRGNVSRAAGSLGISRPTLYELMEKLGIERASH